MGSLLFIAAATLTPGGHFPSGALHPDFWCFACGGADGGADITLNLALFVPLGVALSLLGVSPLRALLIGMLLSMAVECAQHFGWPPDRIASATDLVTNSAGAFVGAIIGWYRGIWIRPSMRVARALTVSGAITVIAFLAFTAWALSPLEPTDLSQRLPGSFQANRLAFTPGFGWYHGSVREVTVDEQSFAHVGDGPLVLYGVTPRQLLGSVSLSGRDERREFVPLLYVHDLRVANPGMMLGQQGDDARLAVSVRGQQLRLPGPSAVLRGAFAKGSDSRTNIVVFRDTAGCGRSRVSARVERAVLRYLFHCRSAGRCCKPSCTWVIGLAHLYPFCGCWCCGCQSGTGVCLRRARGR